MPLQAQVQTFANSLHIGSQTNSNRPGRIPLPDAAVGHAGWGRVLVEWSETKKGWNISSKQLNLV